MSSRFTKSKACRYSALVLAMTAPACSSNYGKPPVAAPASMNAYSPLSDSGLVVSGLVEFGKTFPLRHRPKGAGQLTISAERIEWTNEDDEDRSFSIRPAVVKSVRMDCVTRAGGNVCLEMTLQTITGLVYHFRDTDWAGGYNETIRRARERIERNFPQIVFVENVVDEIK